LRLAWAVPLVAAGLTLATNSAAAQTQTTVRFSLDGRLEGPAAMFVVPQDHGFFSSAGLEVSIEEGATVTEPIARVAAGTAELGFADINALIRYRDQNPSAPVKAVFMVYNTPPFAIVARKSRCITEPKNPEGKKHGDSA